MDTDETMTVEGSLMGGITVFVNASGRRQVGVVAFPQQHVVFVHMASNRNPFWIMTPMQSEYYALYSAHIAMLPCSSAGASFHRAPHQGPCQGNRRVELDVFILGWLGYG